MLLSAQISAEAKSELAVDADRFVGTDNLGAYYYIKGTTLYKEAGGKIRQYQNLALGKIDRVDLCNPLNLMLLYKDFNAVVLLDNQLSENRQIRFSELNQPLVVTAAGIASQNRIWVFESNGQQIGLYDYIRGDYRPISQPLTGKIVFYQNDFNRFHWVLDNREFWTIDVFGKISKLGNAPEFDAACLTYDGKFTYSQGGRLYLWRFPDAAPELIPIGEKSLRSFWFTPPNLSIFTDRGISTYNIKLP